MRREYAKDLSVVKLFAQGAELAQFMGQERNAQGKRVSTHPDSELQYITEFTNPVLVTDDYRIGQLKPPRLRSTVHALFASGNSETVYDGTTLMFQQQKYPTVWGPSIDTLLFTRALGKLDLSTVATAVEIGAGSGFISKYLLDKNPTLRSMALVDMNKQALNCWEDNITDPRAQFICANAFDYMGGRKFDLIVCNPPYIPRPGSIDDNAYEGVGLLRHLIKTMDTNLSPQGKLIINISSLCETEANDAFASANVKPELVDRMTVPLKVFNVINSDDWITFLKKRGLTQTDRPDYEFWQELNILSASLPKKE